MGRTLKPILSRSTKTVSCVSARKTSLPLRSTITFLSSLGAGQSPRQQRSPFFQNFRTVARSGMDRFCALRPLALGVRHCACSHPQIPKFLEVILHAPVLHSSTQRFDGSQPVEDLPTNKDEVVSTRLCKASWVPFMARQRNSAPLGPCLRTSEPPREFDPLRLHDVWLAFGLQPATGGLTADMKIRSWAPTEKKRCGANPW